MNYALERVWKETEVLSPRLPVGSEKDEDRPQVGYPMTNQASRTGLLLHQQARYMFVTARNKQCDKYYILFYIRG